MNISFLLILFTLINPTQRRIKVFSLIVVEGQIILNGEKTKSGMGIYKEDDLELKSDHSKIILLNNFGETYYIEGKRKIIINNLVKNKKNATSACNALNFLKSFYYDANGWIYKTGAVSCPPNGPILFEDDRISKTFINRKYAKHKINWYWNKENSMISHDEKLNNHFIIEFKSIFGDIVFADTVNSFEYTIDYNRKEFDTLFQENSKYPPLLAYEVYNPENKSKYYSREKGVIIRTSPCLKNLQKDTIGKLILALFMEYNEADIDYDSYYKELMKDVVYRDVVKKLYVQYKLRQKN